MALEIKLSQKLSQSLLMTPQLQQAIKLLQLGRLEYLDAINQEVLENPVLEEVKEEPPAAKSTTEVSAERGNETQAEREPELKPLSDKAPISLEDYIASLTDFKGAAAPKGSMNFDERPSLEATLSRSPNLSESLLTQLRYQDLSPRHQEIAHYLIGNLDKNGYLRASRDEVCEACRCSAADFKSALLAVQALEPPGICARDLQECLLIQLDIKGLSEDLAGRIVQNHLDKLEKRKYEQIAKAEKMELAQVYAAILCIQSLEPRPARPFADEEVRYIVPDIYVYKDKDEYVVSLNEDGLPKLKISPYYLSLLQSGSSDSEGRAYLTERLKAASWLIKSIHQRQQTIYKVTESIVKFQRDFLDHGVERLRPLVLKDVADDIGMHESTVSRVTTNKYVHTPQGIYELKFFFTTGIQTTDGNMSSSSVKEKIRGIISQEDTGNPISDQAIVELLKQENILIARRTVAKYRENLGILSSSRRKKLF